MNDRKLSILHLTAGSDAGGLSRYIHDLSCAMLEQGHEVAVAGERGAWHWLFEKSPIEWVDVPLKGNPVDLARAVGKLRKRMKTRPVDVVHCHYRRPTLVSRGLQMLGVKSKSRRRLPVLYTLHLSHIDLSWGRRLVSDFGDHTHVASIEARDWMTGEARIGLERVTLIPHGVRVEQWPVATPELRAAARRELGIEQDARVAVYVGRLDYPKNCNWLLDVAKRWSGGPELRVLLAGEGPEFDELEGRIHREGLADRVRLLGHRAPLAVYHAADLQLLASLREGFSLVCAEGMCTGLPALRTRTSGTSELIVEGVTGAATEIEHEAFVSAALEMLRDETKLRGMRSPAAAHIRAGFTFERQLQATLGLYESLAKL
jgi:glycosyltransferase involved in cell wall biosynthesis